MKQTKDHLLEKLMNADKKDILKEDVEAFCGGDVEKALLLLNCGVDVFDILPESFLQNGEFLCKAIAISPRFIRMIPDAYKTDKVKKAISIIEGNGNIANILGDMIEKKDVSKGLLYVAAKTEPLITLAFMSSNNHVAEVVPLSVRYEVTSIAIEKDPFAVRLLPNGMNRIDNRDEARELREISEALEKDEMSPERVRDISARNYVVLSFATREQQEDPELILNAVKNSSEALKYADEKLLKDKEFMEKAIEYDKMSALYMNEELKADPKMDAHYKEALSIEKQAQLLGDMIQQINRRESDLLNSYENGGISENQYQQQLGGIQTEKTLLAPFAIHKMNKTMATCPGIRSMIYDRADDTINDRLHLNVNDKILTVCPAELLKLNKDFLLNALKEGDVQVCQYSGMEVYDNKNNVAKYNLVEELEQAVIPEELPKAMKQSITNALKLEPAIYEHLDEQAKSDVDVMTTAIAVLDRNIRENPAYEGKGDIMWETLWNNIPPAIRGYAEEYWDNYVPEETAPIHGNEEIEEEDPEAGERSLWDDYDDYD